MRHDAALPLRERRNPPLTWFIKSANIAQKMNHVAHAADIASLRVTAGLHT